jgi:hypothetical protein
VSKYEVPRKVKGSDMAYFNTFGGGRGGGGNYWGIIGLVWIFNRLFIVYSVVYL